MLVSSVASESGRAGRGSALEAVSTKVAERADDRVEEPHAVTKPVMRMRNTRIRTRRGEIFGESGWQNHRGDCAFGRWGM
ncbi:hypothetical protein BOX37_07740 [Nocardia mangyaensis]|uniref:Uncharacterized protein n=1 Tax=Nocardia mangyaensis TaxID=2213200 RepID=A0A1J0VPB5_9NOCA|nr:hypothetical protein BOX37_07740 [Nocardia mangyaensis]